MAREERPYSICILWLILGFQIVLSALYAECLCSANESKALLDLKGRNQSDALASWKEGSDCCSGWAGVTCDVTATHVIALNLTDRLQLSNVNIPKSLCNLHELQVLDIYVGSFYGPVPVCLWNMTKMSYLSIFTTKTTAIEGSSSVEVEGSFIVPGQLSVQGSLPAQVCNLGHLKHLDISGIAFGSGIIPDCLWKMTQLESLILSMGDIFTFSPVCNLRNLTHLDVYVTNDFFNGLFTYVQIPSCIWTLPRLEILTLVGFGKPSSISADVCNMKSLKYLDLAFSTLYGDIPSCIWNLTRLEHLQWEAFNEFPLSIPLSSDICNLRSLSHLVIEYSVEHSYIPDCLWNMTQLEVLELVPPSGFKVLPLHLLGSFSPQLCNFTKLQRFALPYINIAGVPPPCIWNMTHLEYLDLTGMDLSTLEHPGDVSPPSLTVLYLDSTNMNTAFLDVVGSFSALSTLSIAENNIFALPYSIQNLSLLSFLDASSNNIAEVPAWVGFPAEINNPCLYLDDNLVSDLETILDLPGLTLLSIRRNHIRSIPQKVFNSSKLSYLTLTGNPLQSISGLCHLQGLHALQTLDLDNCGIGTLDARGVTQCLRGLLQLSGLSLSGNNISGDLSAFISSSIHNLTQLSSLDLSDNNISGNLSAFSIPAPSLAYLDLSNNKLIGNLSSFSIPTPNLLWYLDVSSNQLTGDLFSILIYTPNLNSLDVSNNKLTGELPRSLLSISWMSLNVSRNQLGGCIPEVYGEGWTLDLSWNAFEGPLPSFAKATFASLTLSGNRFTGPIPVELSRSLMLQTLDLSNNSFSGEIPVYFGKFAYLEVLDLSSNHFNGSIPEALGNCEYLQHLRVKNNSLNGQIPSSICQNPNSLVSFAISYNGIEGPIPSNLGNCANITLLDLSHNNLNGTLPTTLENLSGSLRVLSVAANRLSGNFPTWVVSGNFTSLQVLDLSHNSFYGDLPVDYSKLFGFINGTNSNNNGTLYDDSVSVSAQGGILEITYFVTLRTSFDVSSNHFTGTIPDKLGELRALMYLTLSDNTFSGGIPRELSNLQELESLDLSKNSLSGSIPSDLAALHWLEYFNVSYNSLSGTIPTGGQFNTFNASCFQNNSDLCGFPLSPCPSSVSQPASTSHDSKNQGLLSRWVSLDGFLVGFGTSFGLVGMTFLISERARSWLYSPHREARRVYTYREPYGAYMPKA